MEIERRLGKLPEDLKQTYDEIYSGIKEHEKKIADRAFQWVMCACRPLTTWELLPAISQDGKSDTLLPLDGIDEDLVLEYCHNLLVIDPVRKVWIPSHLSVVEYFENHLWSQNDANFLVLRVCLLVLQDTLLNNREEDWAMIEETFPDEDTNTEAGTEEEASTEEKTDAGAEPSIGEESSLEDHQRDPIDCSLSIRSIATYDPLPLNEYRALSYYARHHWMLHAQKTAEVGHDNLCSSLLSTFLGQPTNSSPAYRCWLRMLICDEIPDSSIFELMGLRPYHLLEDPEAEESDYSVSSFVYCAFDLTRFLPGWHDFNWINGKKTQNHQSHLELAAAFGAVHGCRELLKYGADINEQTHSHYGSALAAAAHYGRQDVVEYLVKEGGAEVNMQLQNGNHGSALAAAAYCGRKEVVEYLVKEGGADMNLQLQYGEYANALEAAERRGLPLVVKLLIELGAKKTSASEHDHGGAR